MDKHLFLFGGSPPFTSNMAKRFVESTSVFNGPVSVLFVEREGWQQYMSRYTKVLKTLGLNEFHILPLPSTSVEEIIHCTQ